MAHQGSTDKDATRHAAEVEAANRHAVGELYSLEKSRLTTFVEGAEWAVAHLRQQGLLAPAPLREEWGTRFEGGDSVFPGKDKHYPFFFEGGPPKGENVHRYVTGWEKA